MIARPPEAHVLTEGAVQSAIWRRRYQECIFTNVFFWDWESDVLMVTRHLYAYEWEIKLSRADFLADFRRKERKHRVLAAGNGGPSRFWFVCQEGQVQLCEVPEYAGFITVEVRGNGRGLRIEELRSAPRIHQHKVTAEDLYSLAKNATYRIWDQNR